MTRRLQLLTFILITCLTSYAQTKTQTKKKEQQKSSHKFDTSVVAILPFDVTQHWFFKNSKPTDLTDGDLMKIETILIKCINHYNSGQERRFKEINDKHREYNLDKKNFIIDLTSYKRQYVSIMNSKGEKEVWVNCFCDTWNTDWRKDLISVDDGGKCYFNLKINLTTEQYYELMINGNA